MPPATCIASRAAPSTAKYPSDGRPITDIRSRLIFESRAAGADAIAWATGMAGGGGGAISALLHLAALDLREVADRGAGVQRVERGVVPLAGLELRHGARRVAQVPEADRAGRAGLLAGGLHLAVADRAPLVLGDLARGR